MKISKNQNPDIPKMNSKEFNTILFKRNIAALLREGKATLANDLAGEIAQFFPEKAENIFQIASQLINSREKLFYLHQNPVSKTEFGHLRF